MIAQTGTIHTKYSSRMGFHGGTKLLSGSVHSMSVPLLAVLGPTGSGKTELAVVLARALGGEIVNFDSIQVYRRLDIGSAKPSETERGGIPHHLLDVLDVTEELTAGAFARRARTALDQIADRRRLPVLVGGTGFYLRALLDGLSAAPQRDPALRERLARRRAAVLHRLLRRCDPVSAQKIHPNDGQKLIRAIEMTVLAGRPASQTQALPRDTLEGYSAVKIGLAPDRAALRRRLDDRCARMFENGLLRETSTLLNEGISPRTKPLQSLGYKQAVAHLTGEMTLAAAIEDCQIKTRQYAKRQMTWFRAEQNVYWLAGFGFEDSLRREAFEYVERSLSSLRT